MLNCRQVSEMASRSLEEKLSLGERMNYWMHLMMCPFCRRFARQMVVLRRIYRYLSNLAPDKLGQIASLPPEAGERIKRNLSQNKKK